MSKKSVHLDINPELWKEFKIACVYYDIPIATTLIKHVQNIVNDYRRDRLMHDKPKVYSHRRKNK